MERHSAGASPQWWHGGARRPIAAGLIAVLAIAVGWGVMPAAAQETGEGDAGPPVVLGLRVGAGYTHYTKTHPDGNAQFARLTLSAEGAYSLWFDGGRVEHYGEEAWGYGLAFRYQLPHGWWLGAGAGTGTGQVIFPEYRVDATLGHAFLRDDNLHVSASYTHEQSKVENSYDRIALGARWWTGPHWIVGGHFNYDIGQPGDTITKSGGLGVTWYTWLERYIGGTIFYGDINYTQIGPTDFLVGYTEAAVRVNYAEYFNPRSGLEVIFDAATNEFYDVYGLTLAFFIEW
jgi:YaiO family outer membrane protein